MDPHVVIVGGGPAAHSAALILARARKQVLICDAGEPANRAARHSHSFFTRDGTPPLELRRMAVEQLAGYDTVHFVSDRVTRIDGAVGDFRVELAGRDAVSADIVLLALGMELVDPELPGFHELWGDTVIHCPYCHGFELRDLPWAVLLTAAELPIDPIRLRWWTEDLIVVLDEGLSIPADILDTWRAKGFGIEHGPIEALRSRDGRLEALDLVGGRSIPRDALLYAPPRRQAAIVGQLGLELDDDGCVVVDVSGQTSVEGVYAAGDMCTLRHQIVFAAADGARVAMAVDAALGSGDRPASDRS